MGLGNNWKAETSVVAQCQGQKARVAIHTCVLSSGLREACIHKPYKPKTADFDGYGLSTYKLIRLQVKKIKQKF